MDDSKSDAFSKETRKATALNEITEMLAEFALSESEIVRPAATNFEDAHILVVDDDEFICRVLERLIDSLGSTVDSAANVTEALQKFEPRKYDVVITDLHMPDGKGTDLLAKIREVDPATPVILLTASPTIQHAMEAVEHQAWRFIQKPFDNHEFQRLIGEAIAYSRVSRIRVEIEKTISAQHALEERFDRGLKSLWITRHKVVNTSRDIVGFEILTRCEESSLMQPEAFWLLASAINRTIELGQKVRLEAADLMFHHPHHLFFINLHVDELLDEILFSDENPLLNHASRVIFEFTERAAGDDLGPILERVEKLRERGFRFGVDDLGAPNKGKASFLEIQPTFIKLDAALVSNIDKQTSKRVLVTRLAEACEEIGIDIVAESVETEGEFTTLRDLGVKYFQGFLFGRPTV